MNRRFDIDIGSLSIVIQVLICNAGLSHVSLDFQVLPQVAIVVIHFAQAIEIHFGRCCVNRLSMRDEIVFGS